MTKTKTHRSRVEIRLSLIFFGSVGKNVIPRLQSLVQVGFVLFHLGYGVFTNCEIYVQSLFSASLDITRLGPLEPCLELESSCRLEETVLSVPPQPPPVSAGLFTVGPEGI